MTFGGQPINIVNSFAKGEIPKLNGHRGMSQNGQPGVDKVLNFPHQCTILLLSVWTHSLVLDTCCNKKRN